MKNLTKKDVCIIIATYNRAEDIDKTLSRLVESNNIPGKVVIIDQSKDKKTKKEVKKFREKILIEYIYCKTPSADISTNIGIRKYRNKFPILLTMGDDVDLLDDYLNEILKEFNSNSRAMAISGIDLLSNKEYNFTKIKNKMSNFLLKMFFLPFKEDHKFRIIGPYGNTHSPIINRKINDAEWLSGFNTCWKSEVYKDYLWPEIIGYNVLDDIDSSYRVYKKYGWGSLIISPKCKVHHRYSDVARYAEKKRIFVNHEDHFSFYYMHFRMPFGTIKFIVSLFGIITGNFIRFFINSNKNNFLKLKYNFEAILYCYKNRKNIENKRYRKFLNLDLTMK